MIIDVVQQIPIFIKPGSMTDPVGATVMNRLVYALRTKGFTCMGSGINIIISDQGECLFMIFGRITFLLASQIKS